MDITQRLVDKWPFFDAKTAIIFEGREITFTQLRSRVFRLTHHLLAQNLSPEANLAVS